jgi:HemY protein
MKTGLIIIVTLLVATVLASLLMQDPGYVMFNFRGYLLETSVPVIVLILIGLYVLVRLLLHVWRAPRALGRMAGQYRARREQRLLTSGRAPTKDVITGCVWLTSRVPMRATPYC